MGTGTARGTESGVPSDRDAMIAGQAGPSWPGWGVTERTRSVIDRCFPDAVVTGHEAADVKRVRMDGD